MTVFDKITQSPEELAAFLTGVIEGTEHKILDKLYEYGIQASLVTEAPELRTANNLLMLLEEVDDDSEDS